MIDYNSTFSEGLALEAGPALLETLYRVHGRLIQDYSLACARGCAACCTRSVTMTSLEGEAIAALLLRRDRRYVRLMESFQALQDVPARPGCTTNRLARSCLAGRQPEDDANPAPWDFTPCPFLDQENCCLVYPARPFMCRGFVSLVRCAPQSGAEFPAGLVSLNTVIMQIIEHIDQGRRWGNMLEVLAVLLDRDEEFRTARGAGRGRDRGAALISEPVPGFLVPPEDQALVDEFLSRFFQAEVLGRPVREWLRGGAMPWR